MTRTQSQAATDDDDLKTSSRKLAKLYSVDGVTIVPSPTPYYRASTNTTSHEPSQLQVSIAIRRGRVAFLTTATVLVLLLLMFTLRRGVELKTISDTGKTPEQQAKLLDDYNSYSGNIASLFGTPVELFVSASVQVISLRFMTRAITAAEPTWKPRVASLALGALAAYLISNGFTAMNVQLKPRGVQPVISAEDLAVAYNQSLPGLTSSVTKSLPETQPRNPITNTMLRNAVLPRVLNQQPHCDPSTASAIPDVGITFGFTQRDWQSRLLNEALPAQQLRTSITDASNMTLLDGATVADMPMNASLAADLYLNGMYLLCNTFDMREAFVNVTEVTQRVPKTSYTTKGVPTLTVGQNE